MAEAISFSPASIFLRSTSSAREASAISKTMSSAGPERHQQGTLSAPTAPTIAETRSDRSM